MEISFLGPLNQVTGSCYWLRDSRLGISFLVDCGIAQGEQVPAYVDAFPFDPASLDFVLLTHAHQDHCGLLAALAAKGFTGVVYCPRKQKCSRASTSKARAMPNTRAR